MSEHIIETLARRYPQLVLPISDDTRQSELYRNTVLRGEKTELRPEFNMSPEDTLELIDTPAGTAEVVTVRDRADFEHCIRALAHRCESCDIPKSMGASTVSGIINWEKIRRRESEYLAEGGEDWDGEFSRFTSDSRNFRDTLIVLSWGPYSAVSAEDAGFPEAQWLEISHEIRKYHELAHFVSRRMFPENKDAVRDEVLADMNGIIGALGHFDVSLARRFLGIGGEGFTEGGRLANYVPPEKLEEAVGRVKVMLDALPERFPGSSKPFEFLIRIEKEKLFL